MVAYDSSFFAYVNSGSLVSAKNMLPILLKHIPINSVLDVGCGQGAWLSIWRALGVKDVIGIDGDYIDRQHLLVPQTMFRSIDLRKNFEIGRKFDLVQSLEVAEHLSIDSASQFVENLCRHGDLVLFSAAPPGQGGHDHVNEQPYEYWRELFSRHDYLAFDFIRPLLADNFEIEPWYRFNVFLYAPKERAHQFPKSVQASLVPADVRLTDISPVSYRVRKAFIRLLPVYVMTILAKIKEKLVTRNRMKRSSGS